MCGIAGIFAYTDSAPRVDQDELLRIRDAMARRGPDGAGLWISKDGRVGLAHRRLAIIDLTDDGLQPMATPDGALRITFNGEIYNYRELRKELEGRGHLFRTQSDTEVLLNLYRDRGVDMVEALRGMYAFAIWDRAKSGLFMARDPFGIKPLYYADDGRSVRFSSQVKAILAGGGLAATTPNAAGQVGFLIWGAVPEPHTLFREIRSLRAGSTLWIDPSGRKNESCFFDLKREFWEAAQRATPLTPQDMVGHLRGALRESVRKHLVADVPVGVFLSSGLDSSVLTGMASEIGGSHIRSITLGFREYKGKRDDETVYSSLIASQFGTAHETRWIERRDFEEELANIMKSMDQPSIDGVNTYFVARAAHKLGMKVAMSGVGSDELLGGYPSFRDVPRMAYAFRFARDFPWLGKALRRVSTPLANAVALPKLAGLVEFGGTYAGSYLLRRALFMPWELARLIDPNVLEQGWSELNLLQEAQHLVDGLANDRCRVSALELGFYMRNQLLRDADWAGMAHSLEIRVPFVDVDWFRAVAPMLAGKPAPSKRHLAATLANPLPEKMRTRKKTGFAIPVEQWAPKRRRIWLGYRHGLRPWAIELLWQFTGKKSKGLVLTTDAFGGQGGIAKYNRDFLEGMCSHTSLDKVVAIPRLMPNDPEPRPYNLQYVTSAVGGKARFLSAVAKVLASERDFDMVVCGHINLIPVAAAISRWLGVPCVLIIYGIDAWTAHGGWLRRLSLRQVSTVVSISKVTLQRFLEWSSLGRVQTYILPNAIRLEDYGPGPKSVQLLDRYGLRDKTVLLTLGRLDPRERYKGFDEVLDALPALSRSIPNLVYVVAGDGEDRLRLEERAKSLGVRERVCFTGYVPELEKVDLYRCADAYVMPSRGEGFGFVFLEAMACGIPAIGSNVDGSREALHEGSLGILVDPGNPVELHDAVLRALKRPKMVPATLSRFEYSRFEAGLHEILADVCGFPAAASTPFQSPKVEFNDLRRVGG